MLSSVSALWLLACATGRGASYTSAVYVEPGLEASARQASPARETGAPAGGSILSEPLQPVRGGERVLPPYLGPNPCKMALRGESPVAKACSDGGKGRAVDLMNVFVRRAREEGITFACVDCHVDEDDYTKLAPAADDDFRKLLFLARPAD